jgi:hypothetical protein
MSGARERLTPHFAHIGSASTSAFIRHPRAKHDHDGRGKIATIRETYPCFTNLAA